MVRSNLLFLNKIFFIKMLPEALKNMATRIPVIDQPTQSPTHISVVLKSFNLRLNYSPELFLSFITGLYANITWMTQQVKKPQMISFSSFNIIFPLPYILQTHTPTEGSVWVLHIGAVFLDILIPGRLMWHRYHWESMLISAKRN